ncbi:MAG: cytochrome c [Opitutaceae bacterium]
MSTPANQDPRADQAAVTDESLLAVHEKLLGKQPDENANYSLMPLVLLFVFSGLIFWAGTYLNRYSGQFDPGIFNENALSTKGAVVAAPPQDPMKVGASVYAVTCANCHLATGLGQTGTIPPLAESEWVTGSEERLVRIALYGVMGPIKVKGTDFNGVMPPHGKVPGSPYNLTDERVAAVLTYVRQSFGNNAPAITGVQVAAIRGKEGERKAMTQDELMKMP